MSKPHLSIALFATMTAVIGCASAPPRATPSPEPPTATAAAANPAAAPAMTFFLTSTGLGDKGANLGGLAGADAHCQQLATAAGAGSRTWHAYLSTSGAGAVNARDRIGHGPWSNAKGVPIATSVDDLHGDKNNLTATTALDEKGALVPGRERADKSVPNEHDILTGSALDGTALPVDPDRSCKNWSATEGTAQVGHFDRMGGGQSPTSWNSAHNTPGCDQASLKKVGGAGRFYCFAID